MISEGFLRDFFGMGKPELDTGWARYERSVVERALKLAEGQPPEANLAPYLEIVKMADRLKLDIVLESAGIPIPKLEPRAKLTHEEARSTICTGCGLTLYACICAPPNRLVEGYCCCPKSGTPHERTPQCDI
jgi:hypothetical protein